MNIFEYLNFVVDKDLDIDEGGNAYLDTTIKNHNYYDYIDLLKGVQETSFRHYLILKEDYEKYCEYEIIVTADDNLNVDFIRRSYYRMRGKPVTEEQAFDIVRRTDYFFLHDIPHLRDHKELVEYCNFDNSLIDKYHFLAGVYGWIHTDGTIGCNAITGKYPTVEEFVLEWFNYLVEFPYLDLIIAVTGWDEMPPEIIVNEDELDSLYTPAYDETFFDAVLLGIYVHDKKVEVLNKQDTIRIYKEYNNKWGRPCEKFEREYYEKNISFRWMKHI